MSVGSRPPECLLCGEGSRRQLFTKDGYPIVRCVRCGLVRVDATISIDELESLYDKEYYTGAVFHDYLGEREERVASARAYCDLLARLQPCGRLLDVGCATGFFLEAAAERWEVTGVELSPYAAEIARQKLGDCVLTGDISRVELPDASFDVVTLWNTIEHMADPVKTLTYVARATAPGGLVVLTTGNVSGPIGRKSLHEWELMAPPEHLFFFSPATISQLLHTSGLSVRRLVFDGIVARDGLLGGLTVRRAASIVGLGNVMTVYCRRSLSPHRGPRLTRAILRRLRPVARV